MDYVIVHTRSDSVVATVDGTADQAQQAFAECCCEHGDYALERHNLWRMDGTEFYIVEPQPPAEVVLSSGTRWYWWRGKIYVESILKDIYDKFDRPMLRLFF